jgi:hypothetical protein
MDCRAGKQLRIYTLASSPYHPVHTYLSYRPITPHLQPSCLSRTVRCFPSSPTSDTDSPDAFPSSAAFDVIHQTLQGDEATRKEAVNQAKAVVAFTIKNADGKEESWHLDLKENGAVGKGAAPQGGKADGESPAHHFRVECGS